MSINLILANEMVDSLPACTCEETCESVWPLNASLYSSSTCVHLRLPASQFGQGFKKTCRENGIYRLREHEIERVRRHFLGASSLLIKKIFCNYN